jgi:hypothetical protein
MWCEGPPLCPVCLATLVMPVFKKLSSVQLSIWPIGWANYTLLCLCQWNTHGKCLVWGILESKYLSFVCLTNTAQVSFHPKPLAAPSGFGLHFPFVTPPEQFCICLGVTVRYQFQQWFYSGIRNSFRGFRRQHKILLISFPGESKEIEITNVSTTKMSLETGSKQEIA